MSQFAAALLLFDDVVELEFRRIANVRIEILIFRRELKDQLVV